MAVKLLGTSNKEKSKNEFDTNVNVKDIIMENRKFWKTVTLVSSDKAKSIKQKR